jgi:integrase
MPRHVPEYGRLRPKRAATGFLADDELNAVWQGAEAIGWPFGQIIRMLVLTGQRRGEVAGMRWQELNFDAKTWTLPKERCKNGIEHVVPLSRPAIEILESLPRIAGDLVFSYNGRTVPDGFDRAKKRIDAFIAGRKGQPIPEWRLHDLRRTFASGCARLGIAIHVVERCLNHSSGTFRGIVSVYQKHDFADEKRVAMETWARHVESVVSGDAGGNVIELKAN